MPSLRVFLCLAAATLWVVVGVVVPGLAVQALIFDGLLLLAFAFDLWRSRAVEVQVLRKWPPLLMQGTAADVTLEVSNGQDRKIHLRLREALHPGLAAAPQQKAMALPAKGVLGWTYRILPQRRGEHSVGPLTLRVLGPWGLAWSQREVLGEEQQKVFPQVRWDGKVGQLLVLAHHRSLGRLPQRLQGMGTEPYALREYRTGDPPQKIHWKATARHGRLVSREDTWERGARLLVMLDCGRGMSGMDGQRSKLDHALAAALALTRVATARGDRVTLVTFSDRVEHSLRLHGGQRSIHIAYSQLYDLEARLAEPAFDQAVETAIALETRRSTAILMTSVVDLAAAELLRQAVLRLERRHRPILVNLQDPEILEVAKGEPENPEDAFAKVAALDIVDANRRLARRLRKAGVRVVETAADRLALETLDAYLSLFWSRR